MFTYNQAKDVLSKVRHGEGSSDEDIQKFREWVLSSIKYSSRKLLTISYMFYGFLVSAFTYFVLCLINMGASGDSLPREVLAACSPFNHPWILVFVIFADLCVLGGWGLGTLKRLTKLY